ncbi:MAG TPA: hypothetical protein VGA20_06130 [Gemmatimonadales bacterium]
MAQATWKLRIVDQETGAPVPGVPVTVLDDAGTPVSYWVSDTEGLVAIPKSDRPRLRLRVGLRSEEPIELETRTIGGDPLPLAAPRRAQPVGVTPTASDPVDPALTPPTQALAPDQSPPQILRFARIGVLPKTPDGATMAAVDLAEFHAAEFPAPIRYGVVLETEELWQALGTEAGDLLYSVSLAPGDEVRALVLDGRWRRAAQRERPLQIVAKMVGTTSMGDNMDSVPLEPFVLRDLAAAAAETVGLLADRTIRVSASLRRRPLGVTEAQGDPPESAAIRTVRNSRDDAVVTYHFVEPLERYRVVVRTPRVRPAILVPFRLPNLATPEVVRQFGHVLKRSLIDRSLTDDLEVVRNDGRTPAGPAERLFAHISANLPYYSATIIAAGDPAARYQALAKLRDPAGRALTDVIENTVVGRVGNYVAFPLRAAELLPDNGRPLLRADPQRFERLSEELTLLLPLPGVWIKAEVTQPLDKGAEEPQAEGEERGWRGRRGRRA